MNRILRAAALGVGIGLAGAMLFLTPVGHGLEEGVGLDALFALRGPREAPRAVVVIGIEARAPDGDHLFAGPFAGCPAPPPRSAFWTRCMYAALIDTLSAHDPAALVMDVAFLGAKDPAEDAMLEAAIGRSGRIILLERMERERIATGDGFRDTVVPPYAPFAERAAARAPFPLPKVPTRVRQSWAFKAELGDAPTLPTAAFHVYALHRLERLGAIGARATSDAVARALVSDDLRATMQRLRRSHLDGGDGAGALASLARAADDTETARLLDRLARLYAGAESRFLNFYGPPGTIRTLSAIDLMTATADARARLLDGSGTAFFVGVVDRSVTDQVDAFPTVFSTDDGVDLNGVEIAATAFANLVADDGVARLSNVLYGVLLVAVGIVLGAAAGILAPLAALAATVLLGGLYAGAAALAFAEANLWLPLAIPAFVQLPLALLLGIGSHYVVQKRRGARVSAALRHYVPEEVVERFLDRDESLERGDTVYGICLATDAQDFTTFAESLPPAELRDLMNAYFETLTAAVNAHGGRVADIVADSIMCIWQSDGPETARRADAVRATLAMAEAIDDFNRRHPDRALPTRFGLHAGWVSFGSIGGGGRFAYGVIGDIANTASRIEGLNKYLGTTVLASAEVLGDSPDVAARRVGRFRLKGKSDPLDVFEVRGAPAADATDDAETLLEPFAAALAAAESGDRERARSLFAALEHAHPADGPTRFHARRCRETADASPAGDPSIIEMARK